MSDKQRKTAGIESLNQRCTYCSRVLYAYPLIMGDDAQHSVYHIACAVELAQTSYWICLISFVRLPLLTGWRCSRPRHLSLSHEEAPMQSTDLEEIKVALWEQAYHLYVANHTYDQTRMRFTVKWLKPFRSVTPSEKRGNPH